MLLTLHLTTLFIGCINLPKPTATTFLGNLFSFQALTQTTLITALSLTGPCTVQYFPYPLQNPDEIDQELNHLSLFKHSNTVRFVFTLKLTC